jgi:hypothetical protein
MSVKKLDCGGSITHCGDAPGIYRVVRQVGQGERRVTFILLHPPKLKKGEVDNESALCEKFAVSCGFGELCILYLFPYLARTFAGIQKMPVPWGAGVLGRRIQDIEIHRTINAPLGGVVIAGWGDLGRKFDADKMLLKRFDGTPPGFGWQRGRVYPIHVLSLTRSKNPARLSASNIKREPRPLYAVRSPPGCVPDTANESRYFPPIDAR